MVPSRAAAAEEPEPIILSVTHHPDLEVVRDANGRTLLQKRAVAPADPIKLGWGYCTDLATALQGCLWVQ